MKKIIFIIFAFILCSQFLTAQINVQSPSKDDYLEIGKAKIYYEEKGEGTPLIMIHGGFLDRRMWDNQFDYFSKKYRVIRYDVRNHGLTESEADTYTNYDDLNSIMGKLNIDKAIVMGLSLGGMIAIDFAIAHPDKVIALIPVSTGVSGNKLKDKDWLDFDAKLNEAFEKNDEKTAAECMLKYWTDGMKRKPEEVNSEMRNYLKKMILETFGKWNPNVKPGKLTPPAYERLSEIKSPFLTICGDIDLPGILDLADKIEKEVPGAKKYMIKNSAHMVNMDYPDKFNSIVSYFLDNLNFNITTEQAEKMIAENSGKSDFIILDVRTPEEVASGYISGSVNIDIKAPDFQEKINALSKDKTYIVYCKRGGRSSRAFDMMKEKGFDKVYNMLGGIMKWKEENRKVEIK
jgi:3-oxoadipate enol-lactonase